MKKFIFLLTTTIMLSAAGYAKTTEPPQNDQDNPVEHTINDEGNHVLFSQEKALDLGCTLPIIPPIVMEWEVGGPIFYIDYTIRFKSTEDGTKMVITCDLIKKL